MHPDNQLACPLKCAIIKRLACAIVHQVHLVCSLTDSIQCSGNCSEAVRLAAHCSANMHLPCTRASLSES